MAMGSNSNRSSSGSSGKVTSTKLLEKDSITNGGLLGYIKDIFTNKSNYLPMIVMLMMAEVVLNYLVVRFIGYTNIDWSTYMQQIDLFIQGERNYMKLEGDTGPVVYPAGFIYVYSLLYKITGLGEDVRFAQWIFVGIYLTLTLVVFFTYSKSKSVPPYVLILLILSKRIHSIFGLRLFNDGIAMLLFYVALLLFVNQRWSIGCFFFSLAVSIKMNVLLFAPALLLLMLMSLGYRNTIKNLFICGSVQVLVGLPFLLHNPYSYLFRAFEFSRQFLFKWTVNWRFVPVDIFLSKQFALGLLGIHLSLLIIFVIFKWTSSSLIGANGNIINNSDRARPLSPTFIMTTMFTANIIGITFSRSLHYQFYVWYFHSLPFLLWQTDIPVFIKVAILGAIEYCWNVYPSTNLSSALLFACNLVIVLSLLFSSKLPSPFILNQSKSKKLN